MVTREINENEKSKASEIKLNGLFSFVKDKAIFTTSIGALTGAMHGYYAADSLALYLYTYTFSAGLSSVSYFGGSYLLSYLRQKEDIFNYLLSGAFTGGAVYSTTRGLRKIPLGVIGGSIIGSGLYVGSLWSYNYFRSIWIKHRIQMLEERYIYDEIMKHKHLNFSTFKSTNINGKNQN